MKEGLFVVVAAFAAVLATATAQVPSILNYQGRVTVGGTNFDGTGQFKFALVNSNGTASFWKNDGTTSTNEPTNALAVAVAQGAYALLLGDTNSGNMAPIPPQIFSNNHVRLRVWFSAGGTNPFVLLSPDQRLASVGYAVRAGSVDSMGSTNPSGSSFPGDVFVAGTLTAGKLISGTNNTAAGAFAAAGGGSGNTAGGNYATIAGGYINLASRNGSSVAGGGRNAVTNEWGMIGGGYSNAVGGYAAFVGGGWQNSAAGNYASVVGGSGNSASGIKSCVGGGEGNISGPNEANTVGGGLNNTAGGPVGFLSFGMNYIGGGFSNSASGGFAVVSGGYINSALQAHATVGGGDRNNAAGVAAVIGGGAQNTNSYDYATVGGGQLNDVLGNFGTVPGGYDNAAAENSFAAGRQARALHANSFVWNSETGTNFASVRTNSFSVNASGGAWFSHDVSVATLTIRGGADLAEPFETGDATPEPGTVMVIDEVYAGRLKPSSRAYDTKVAGVVSGANGIQPAITARQEGRLDRGSPVALTGRVYVKADADYGAIRPGDLLVTSDTPGHAMRADDHSRANGAILGKAMSSLDSGRGEVLVLVGLQ